MKVTTDACLFGAFAAAQIQSQEFSVQGQLKVLDIGTGTGLLSLMFAQKNPNATIDGIEIDPDAAVQAKENVEQSPWSERIKVIHADIRQVTGSLPPYDIIICNPPFHENQLTSDNSRKNTAHHSSELSLEELLRIIRAVMKAGGKFYLLLPYYRLEEIKKLIKNEGLSISKLVKVKQSVNHDYFRIIIEGTNSEQKYTEERISICKEGQEYTSEFIDLLKDYYLYLN